MAETGVPYKPQLPYSGKQIVIDSDRVHLNAKEDFILLLANKSIGLSAGLGSINLDAKADVVINAEGKIRLGIKPTTSSTNEVPDDSPLVKGDQLVGLLSILINVLNDVATGLDISVDSDGHPVTGDKLASSDLKTLSQAVSPYLSNLLSTKSFTR